MARVTIYTSMMCGYCSAAKQLLSKKQVAFHEVDVSYDPEGRRAMSERAGGRRTVPQIFIGETHVGGCNELYALDKAGELDRLLGEA